MTGSTNTLKDENINAIDNGGVSNAAENDYIGLLLKIRGLPANKKVEIYEMLKQENEQNKIEQNGELYGNKEAIIKNLKEKYVKIDENAEMMGYKGKKIHFELPAIGNLEKFNFDCFISNNTEYKRDFLKNSKLVSHSYSMGDIASLLTALNKYMLANGVKIGGDTDFENDLKERKTNKYNNATGDILKEIMGLDKGYRLSDKNIDGEKDSCGMRDCRNNDCCFSRTTLGPNSRHILLKLD